MNYQNQHGLIENPQQQSPHLNTSNIFVPFFVPIPMCEHPEGTKENVKQIKPDCEKLYNNEKSTFILNLQVLISQLLEVKGVISCFIRRILLKYLPSSDEKANVEEIINGAKKHINSLTRDQLLSELISVQKVFNYLTFHEHCTSLTTILKPLRELIDDLKKMVNDRLNKKLMENQGLGNNGLDERILSLKTNEELIEFLNSLRKKEFQERVNLNFAPYRAERIVAENHLNCTRMKINQVKTECNKREARKHLMGPTICRKEPYFDAFYC